MEKNDCSEWNNKEYVIEAVKNNGYATITENVYYASKELQKEILELLELKSVIPDGFIKENAG